MNLESIFDIIGSMDNEDEILYLNQADGRKGVNLKHPTTESASSDYNFIKEEVIKILGLENTDTLFLAQNATTCLINILKPILQEDYSYEVLISTHEIRWFKTIFDKGELPTDEVTFPNYAPLEPKKFLVHPYTIFDPHVLEIDIEKYIKKGKKQIIIISHISRITGEVFVTEKMYRKIHSINPECIVVVDGNQAVGVMQVYAKNISNIYIGVTSKFIDAEPHIGFVWVDPVLIKTFNISFEEIVPETFSRELYSAKQALSTLIIAPEKIIAIKNYLKEKLSQNNIKLYEPKNQAPHIAFFQNTEPDKAVNFLRERNVIISTNTGYSITEPEIPCIRISLTPKTTIKNIDTLVELLVEYVKQ